MTPEEEKSQVLRRLYEYNGLYYLLVGENGGFIYEHPEDYPNRDPKETILRLFVDSSDAITYLNRGDLNIQAQVKRVTLLGLWSLLPGLQEACMEACHAPLRIDASTAIGDKAVTVDILHSSHALLS